MAGFTKLFSSITESSIWMASDKTLRVWVAMLARADSDGIVEGSPPAFAHLCRMSIEDFLACEAELMGPDPYSRTPDHEGRRLEKVQGGWRVLNYIAYRDKGQGKTGSRAPYMREYRNKRGQSAVTRNNDRVTTVTRNTEAEAEAEAEGELKLSAPPASSRAVQSDASIPTIEEVLTEANMQAIPEAVARKFWEHREGKNDWLNQYGRLINWRQCMRTWASRERQTSPSTSEPKSSSLSFRERDALARELEALKAERVAHVGKRPYARGPNHDQRLVEIDSRIAEIERQLS